MSLTSALKKTDVGVYDTIVQASKGKFNGGHDLVFNLKNNGVGVGKISPQVKPAWIAVMNKFRAQVVSGKLKPPATLK